MDSQQSWNDFHFLNSALSDVIEASTVAENKIWIQTSLVRLAYRGSGKNHSGDLTVQVLDGLVVEYAVPFPLTYVFQPSAMQVYNEVFVLLLQIRRAKNTLERVFVRARAQNEDLRVFYAMKNRLGWFLKYVCSTKKYRSEWSDLDASV